MSKSPNISANRQQGFAHIIILFVLLLVVVIIILTFLGIQASRALNLDQTPKVQYENPFNQVPPYQNPFDDYQNPFAIAQ